MMKAREIAAGIKAGALDPVTVTQEALTRCEASQPRLNALTVIDAAKALADAEAVRGRIGKAPLPLAGVPIVVKDNIWVGGWKITQGSRYFADHIAPRDALCVERAKAAGAVVVGIGTCSEFACKGQTTTPLHGTTRNPLDLSLTPGGSSGGNSAIVAAGGVPVSIGTDGGGSSRRPPSHCGLVGFKPSYGAIAHPFGFAEPFWWLTSISPIAQDVEDAALLFTVMAGEDVRDPESRPLAPERRERVAGLRLAYHPKLGLDVPVDPDVAAAFDAALTALRKAGLSLTERAPVWPSAAERASLGAIQFAGLAAIHGAAYRARPDLIDPDVARQIEDGFAVTGIRFAEGVEASQRVRRTVGAFFADFDLLLSPTTACVAWSNTRLAPETIDGQPVDSRGHAVFTPLFNHAQTPAISIPCGRGRNGLPVGLQIVGAVGEDRRVLAFARHAERILAEAGLWNGITAGDLA